ncbi:hypothetical protein DICVIV_11510 [Dictyocaulus viviparus]|uniref:Uncharacterized protein n=1 Tax=Dictyocaulus viviparus TaxID=29172 RepID=A0A0D8XJI9_DICVI|nr:hypothetical protein DICVIV_11510 [Dictyocaulus viviparus]
MGSFVHDYFLRSRGVKIRLILTITTVIVISCFILRSSRRVKVTQSKLPTFDSSEQYVTEHNSEDDIEAISKRIGFTLQKPSNPISLKKLDYYSVKNRGSKKSSNRKTTTTITKLDSVGKNYATTKTAVLSSTDVHDDYVGNLQQNVVSDDDLKLREFQHYPSLDIVEPTEGFVSNPTENFVEKKEAISSEGQAELLAGKLKSPIELNEDFKGKHGMAVVNMTRKPETIHTDIVHNTTTSNKVIESLTTIDRIENKEAKPLTQNNLNEEQNDKVRW